MNKKIKLFIVLLLGFFTTTNAFAYEIEGYRFWYNDCRFCWVDVSTVLNEGLDIIFQDLSPIQKVYYNKGASNFFIIKEKSEWLFHKSTMMESWLELINPNLNKVKDNYRWELIYEKP